MNALVAKLDDWGRPGWIGAMVVGFVVFWPVGLAILFYMLWSGRMGCYNYAYAGDRRDRWERKMERMQMKMDRMRSWFGDGRDSKSRAPYFAPTGNHAFDEYREDTLNKLEQEAEEFRSFLDRLRHAKDKAEFDMFMSERRAPKNEPKDITPRDA